MDTPFFRWLGNLVPHSLRPVTFWLSEQVYQQTGKWLPRDFWVALASGVLLVSIWVLYRALQNPVESKS